MVEKRVYGLDPGNLKNPREVKMLDEVALFLKIEELGCTIFKAWYETKNSEQPVDVTEEEYALDFCAYQTKKFGVELTEDRTGETLVKTPSYNAWYYFYRNHFYNNLSEEELHKFIELRKKGICASVFLPKKSWLESIKKN